MAAAPIRFPSFSMCWNAKGMEELTFDNTMEVKKGHSIKHLLGWTAVVARGAPGGKLQALVVNCHGAYDFEQAGSIVDSSGGVPVYTGGFGLLMGEGIGEGNAGLFNILAGLVKEINIFACGAALEPRPWPFAPQRKICQAIADASRAVVVASTVPQPDEAGPGLNMTPAFVGPVIRFRPKPR